MGEALGDDYAAAIARAEMLNGHLDAWRQRPDNVIAGKTVWDD